MALSVFLVVFLFWDFLNWKLVFYSNSRFYSTCNAEQQPRSLAESVAVNLKAPHTEIQDMFATPEVVDEFVPVAVARSFWQVIKLNLGLQVRVKLQSDTLGSLSVSVNAHQHLQDLHDSSCLVSLTPSTTLEGRADVRVWQPPKSHDIAVVRASVTAW
eukprot:6456668-Amphidinium_carterae.1